ncbi:MAG: phosphomannose isomerase type II C-terminal cupin domain [Alcanivorax sp.]|nr:phosphomannose isomerase type II C-terminal cupin domain [Alcanivorax sp.]
MSDHGKQSIFQQHGAQTTSSAPIFNEATAITASTNPQEWATRFWRDSGKILGPNIKRPWGSFMVLYDNGSFWIKKLCVNHSARLSLQSHQYRDEVWVVMEGEIQAQVDNQYFHARENDVVIVPRHRRHRIIGVTNACVMEFAFGKVRETDIVRYQDDYGRIE